MDLALTWSRRCRWLLLLLWLAIWLIRLSGPDDICDDNKQERQATYVLDLLKNDHWVFQENHFHELAGKPPLYTWLCALTAKVFCGGELNRFSLTFPGSIAVLLTALLLFEWSRRRFNWLTGFFAGLFWLLTPVAGKLVMLGRIEAVFTFFIFAAFFAGLEALRGNSSWLWFWLAATASNFAKGPLGLLLSVIPVLFVAWSLRGDKLRPGTLRDNLVGLLIFLGLGFGWFFAAKASWGQAFIDRTIHGELVGQVVNGPSLSLAERIKFFLDPLGHLLGRCLPWTLLLLPAGWILWRKHIINDSHQRREIQSLWVYTAFGLFCFCVASHHRPDLIFPLVPAVCLIAAWGLVKLVEARWSLKQQLALALTASILILAGLTIKRFTLEQHRAEVVRTAGIKELHRNLADLYPSGRPPLEQTLETVFGLQLIDQTHRQHISCEAAAVFLKSNSPALVAVQQLDAGPLALAIQAVNAEGIAITADQLVPGTCLSVDIARLNSALPGPVAKYDSFGFPSDPKAYHYQWQTSSDGNPWNTDGQESSYTLKSAVDATHQLRLQLQYVDCTGDKITATQVFGNPKETVKFASACARLGVKPELILSWPIHGNDLNSESFINIYGNAAAKALATSSTGH